MARPHVRSNKGKQAPSEDSVTMSFRLAKSDKLAYLAKCEKAGLSMSEYMRTCVLENKTEIIEKPKKSKDHTKALFLIASASNNLNQLAKRANTDAKTGVITQETYEDIANNLHAISITLKTYLTYAD